MTNRVHTDKRPRIRKKIVCIYLALLVLPLVGCGLERVKIRGRVVSYVEVRLKKMQLRYLVKDKNWNITGEGKARIKANGDFTIAIKETKEFPCYVQIKGFQSIPESSVAGYTFVEIKDKNVRIIDAVDIYIYDPIRIVGDFEDPILLRDLKLRWESDIPDVDFFKVKLLGKTVGYSSILSAAISISGLKGDSFSFEDIEHLLRKKGKQEFGELQVKVNNDRIEGSYYLNVEAVRIVDDKPVTVAVSKLDFVTIKRN